MHLPVRVYIYEENYGNVEVSKSLFTGKSDNGNKIYIETISVDLHNKHDNDYQIVLESFNLASTKKNYEDTYILICKSTAISSASSNTILNVIEKVVNDDLNGTNCFDIFYLSKWLDRCDQYSNVHEFHSGLNIVNTYSPHGIHCLMFSPRGRNKFLIHYNPNSNPICDRSLGHVLNSRIGHKNTTHINIESDEVFIAITTTPSIINYDIINGKGDPSNNLKLCECRDIPHPSKPEFSPTTSHMAFFWLLIIIIFVCLIVFILIRYYINKYNWSIGGFYPSPPKSVLPPENALF